jgi:hypothetical protein
VKPHGWIDAGDGKAAVVQEATIALDPQQSRDGLPFGLRLSVRIGKVTAYAVLSSDYCEWRQ